MSNRVVRQIVPATLVSEDEEDLQYAREVNERDTIIKSLNSASLRYELDARIDDAAIYGGNNSFILFNFRVSGINLSYPNILMHLWELFIIIILMFSLINVWIPTSPYFWVPLSIWIATIVYVIFLLICVLTLPSPSVAYTWKRARDARYQRNDALHLWWGTLLHFFVSVFYLIWYLVPAAGTLPIDPLTNLVVYLGQRALHIILVAGCMAILFTRPFANNVGLTGTVLYRKRPPRTAAEFDEKEMRNEVYDDDEEPYEPVSMRQEEMTMNPAGNRNYTSYYPSDVNNLGTINNHNSHKRTTKGKKSLFT